MTSGTQEADYWELLKLMEAGAFGDAAPRFEALVARANDARFHAAYGICLQQLSRWPGAIEQFELALANKPAYCEADWRNMLADCYLQDRQKKRAIEQWRRVASMRPTYPNYDEPIDDAKAMLERHA